MALYHHVLKKQKKTKQKNGEKTLCKPKPIRESKTMLPTILIYLKISNNVNDFPQLTNNRENKYSFQISKMSILLIKVF